MMDATRETGRVLWPRDARAEVTLAMAKLSLFLASLIIKDRMGDRLLSSIDPAEEQAYLASEHGKERARNTGRNAAEGAWNRLYDEYVEKYPLLIGSTTPQAFTYRTKRWRHGESIGTKKNHFVPVLANKPWADSDGNVLVARHWVDGGVHISKVAFKNWGHESFLYPQWLENYFQAVESDAAPAYRHLLGMVPLPPDELRIFTTFLVLQV